MILYDHDDKLLVASEHQIKLWNFDESKYEMPEIWTTEEFKDPIENVFVNQYSRGPLTIVVISNDKLFIFKNRLELVCHADLYGVKLLCGAFNHDCTEAYFGTSKGKIQIYDTKTGHMKGDPVPIDEEFNLPITSIQRFVSVGDENIFLLTVNNQKVEIWNETIQNSKLVGFEYDGENITEDMKICYSQVAFNSKFFIIGLTSENRSALGIFQYLRDS